MRGVLVLENKNKNQEIKKKLEYIGLNLEEIPETLKLVEELHFQPNAGIDEKKYRQYKFVSPKEIEILLSPTNRLEDVKEKYAKAEPLAYYLDSTSEENEVKHETFLRMLKEVKIEDIENINFFWRNKSILSIFFLVYSYIWPKLQVFYQF